jgi:anti-anti-sigma factor
MSLDPPNQGDDSNRAGAATLGQVLGSPPVPATAHRDGDATVLVLTGELDYNTGPQVLAELRACLAQRPAVLVLDLAGVTFLGSMGLSVFIEAHRAAQNTALRVVADHLAVLRPIQIQGLTQYLAVYPSRADALAGTSQIHTP